MIKMSYSIKSKNRIYVEGYGFLSFVKNIGKDKSNKYSQKLHDSAKKSTTDAIKPASKRAIQKTAKTTGDLTGNKIADKVTSVSKTLHPKTYENETRIRKERYIFPEKKTTNY